MDFHTRRRLVVGNSQVMDPLQRVAVRPETQILEDSHLSVIAATVRAYRSVLWLTGAAVATMLLLRRLAHAPPITEAIRIFVAIDAAAGLALIGWTAALLVHRRPMDRPVRASYAAAFQELRRAWWTREWVATTALLAILVPLTLIADAGAQPAIAIAHPFAWDVRIDALERWMHFGKRGWEWLQPLVGHARVTRWLDALYFPGWPDVMLAATVLPIVAPETALRRRYAIAAALLWFVGGMLAELAFSSGGPVYYGRIASGPNPYATLMTYLARIDQITPLVSASLQRGMWASYAHRIDAFGIGVAAMPSLHVGSVTLLACTAFSIRRWLGVVATVFALLIFVGSVALGWHYAVDGYAGALIAGLSWWIGGRLSATPATRTAIHTAPESQSVVESTARVGAAW